ncbi:MAG: TonB-dependent receptor plug domain-containing protein, partial [Fimbriimonadales bacterium]
MRGKTLWILALGVVGTAHAQDQDLGSMGIEDLMKLQVTTASRQEQVFMNVPAAIYVVTGDDIRKSGAVTVPDMLRMVPGLQVFVVDGNKWSVSIRGFGSRYANKL